MVVSDPYTATGAVYECVDCSHRTTEREFGRCPACAGTMRNIAVSRW